MTERKTIILSLRIPRDLASRVDTRVATSTRRSRNDWLIWAIKQGLRRHRKNNVNILEHEGKAEPLPGVNKERK